MSNSLKLKKSLGAKLSIGSIIIILTFGIIIGGYFTYRDQKNLRSSVVSEIRKSARFFCPPGLFSSEKETGIGLAGLYPGGQKDR